MTSNSSDENAKERTKSTDSLWGYSEANTAVPIWSSLRANNDTRSSQWHHSNSDTKEKLLEDEIGKKRHEGAWASLLRGERITVVVVVGTMLLLSCSLGVSVFPSARHAIFGAPDKYVAFIGNSMMYYYDLPRSLQIFSDYKVQQNCLLSGAGAFERQTFLQNGMWNRWRSDGALLHTLDDDEVNVNGYADSFYDNKVYDLGACTMNMLLFGYNHTEAEENYDAFWNYREQNGVTDDYGWVYDWKSDLDPRLNNPCTQSQAYLDFLNNLPSSDIRKNPKKWDYLTFKVYMGYKQYATFVQKALPRSQKPKLVNMGIAFLVVFEENLDLWNSLFWKDKKHPSPHGSFLESCLVHHAVYGRVPYKSTVIRDDMQSLWNGTRNLMYPRDTAVPFPTKQEAEYLYEVCERVAGGYIPPTFRSQLTNGLSMYQ
eukprot:scaffold18388_cov185-Amphora_coffeaeformis.AAC.3